MNKRIEWKYISKPMLGCIVAAIACSFTGLPNAFFHPAWFVFYWATVVQFSRWSYELYCENRNSCGIIEYHDYWMNRR